MLRFKSFIKRHRLFVVLLSIVLFFVFLFELLSWVCLPGFKNRVYTQLPTCYDLIKYSISTEAALNYGWGSNPSDPSASEFVDVENVLASGNVYYIGRNVLHANGRACYPYVFIADDMPTMATRYVEAHEAFHILGVRSETQANYKAALIEPLGMVQVVFISVFGNLKLVDLPCRLGVSWLLFKAYFLWGL
ncbi:hypothetical protein KC614_00550 [candidate division WWE3 bacterium]|uniref:Uncharacterized protein n=1 Tax=candidate division WWE3 bacterium TaxID=2053526 RepID=A0A955LK56_UNCKA|nr:hypothetical protein [candidate division WWE3 bacterium]